MTYLRRTTATAGSTAIYQYRLIDAAMQSSLGTELRVLIGRFGRVCIWRRNLQDRSSCSLAPGSLPALGKKSLVNWDQDVTP